MVFKKDWFDRMLQITCIIFAVIMLFFVSQVIWDIYHPPKGYIIKSYKNICAPQYFAGQHLEIHTDDPWYEGQTTENYLLCIDKDGRNPTLRTIKKTFVLIEQK